MCNYRGNAIEPRPSKTMRYFQFKGPGAAIIGVESNFEAYEKSPANFKEVFPEIQTLEAPKKKMGRPKKIT